MAPNNKYSDYEEVAEDTPLVQNDNVTSLPSSKKHLGRVAGVLTACLFMFSAWSQNAKINKNNIRIAELEYQKNAAVLFDRDTADYIDNNYEFYQGKDSNGGDCKYGMGRYSLSDKFKKCSADPDCLGFNTNGYAKCSLLPQSKWSTWTSDPNKGFYLKTNTVEYNFFQGLDSNGGDCKYGMGRYSLEEMFQKCSADPDCLGFNTNGYPKCTLKPQSKWSKWTSDPNKGLYLKVKAPEYQFFQGLDSNGGDCKYGMGRYSLEQKFKICSDDPDCLGFNTNGYAKCSLKPQSKWSKWTSDPNKGFYLKV